MNKEEIAAVVAKVKLGDNREVNELVLREWFDTIGHLRFQDAVEAVTMHRQESTDYLMPVHIVRNVRRIVDARVEQMKALESRTEFAGDPAPENMAALEAAWADPVAFAREVAVYERQLVAAGLPEGLPYSRGRR